MLDVELNIVELFFFSFQEWWIYILREPHLFCWELSSNLRFFIGDPISSYWGMSLSFNSF